MALKELVFPLAPDASTIDAFEREADLLSAVQHPQVPRFLARFQEGEGVHLRLYVAQEYVDGPSLHERLRQGALSDPEVRSIARQLFTVLDALHTRTPPLLHRDVKPANLLVRSDGTLVLVDFGAARIVANGQTHGATLVGTFGYMAPEQLGGTVSPASDLYSAGATLLQLLTGASPSELLGSNLAVSLPRNVPEAWRPFLSELLAANPMDRPLSARSALSRLDALGVTTRQPGVSTRRSLLPGLAEFGVVLVLGALATSLFFWFGVAGVSIEDDARPSAPLATRAPGTAPLAPAQGRAVATEEQTQALARLSAAETPSAQVAELDQLLYGPLARWSWPAEAEATLLPLLDSPNVTVRERTAKVLERLADPSLKVVDALLAHSRSTEALEVRKAAAVSAAKLLLRLRPRDEALRQRADRIVDLALDDPDETLRIFTASQLPLMHPLSEAALSRVRERLLTNPGRQGTQLLAILIGHMAQLAPTEAEALSHLKAPGPHQRHLGVVMLAHVSPSELSVTAVAGLAKTDPDDAVRADALRVLGQAGPLAGPHLEVLRAGLSDSEPSVRSSAAEAVGTLGRPVADVLVPELRKLASADVADSVRAAAAEALRSFEATSP